MISEQPRPSLRTPEMVVNQVQPVIIAQAQKIGLDSRIYQNNFATRVAVEHALAKYYRSSTKKEEWGLREGFYGADNNRVDEGLGDVELAMNNQIEELLKRRQGEGRPVVVIDFGGGLGLSMIRLASIHREAIESGDLVIAVTNLGYTPSNDKDAVGYSGVASVLSSNRRQVGRPTFFQDQLQFVQDNQSLVTFLDVNAAELAAQSITPRGRQPMSLDGAVDIIHESYAVMHTHAPDVALAVFGELLGDEGSLYLHTRERDFMHSVRLPYIQIADGDTIRLDNQEYVRSRRDALDVGLHLLVDNYGLSNVTNFRSVRTGLFTKKHSPRIAKEPITTRF